MTSVPRTLSRRGGPPGPRETPSSRSFLEGSDISRRSRLGGRLRTRGSAPPSALYLAAGKLSAAAALFALFWWLSPPNAPSFHLCPFYWLTARPCPLCGITRAFCALAKGHWAQAIHLHALSPLAFVMLFSLFWKFRWRAPLWTWGLAAIGTYGVWRAAGI